MEQDQRRILDLQNTEKYVLSACLHNDQALAKAMNSLTAMRDFKIGNNSKAFGILQSRYRQGEDVDPVVVCDSWIDLDIYSSHEAKEIQGFWQGDVDFEPKIDELAKIGGVRKAKKDITKLHQLSTKDVTPDELAKEAFNCAVSWNKGATKKYKTAFEVHNEKDNRGEKLNLGIPLLDDRVYKNAGLHKGTVKSSIFRSKHGKTRSACWEVAQHLRQGRNVMYFTLEGQNNDILNNVKQVLKDRWKDYGDSFYLVDSAFDIDSIEQAYIEAEFTHGVDVCVIDYLQDVQLNAGRYVNDNERISEACRRLTQLSTKYNTLINLLSQVTTTDDRKSGYGHVPKVHDAYGSKKIIKASSMITVGFRPKNFEELIAEPMMPNDSINVKAPNGEHVSLSSVFMKPALSRKKLDCQHQWIHFVDTNNGFQIKRQGLI